MLRAPAGGLLLLLSLAAAVPAQSTKVTYVVTKPGTEVHALASDQPESYVTNRLDKGAVVEVVQEMPGGWLEIRPPTGSTSWISKALLDPTSPDNKIKVVALEEGAPIFPSPADATSKRPTVIGARLKRGHLVVRRGQVINDEKEGTWVEIESPETEARYVRADAVERRQTEIVPTGAAESAPLRKSQAQSAAIGAPAGSSAAEEARAAAVAADVGGNYAEAVRLYDRIVEQFGDSHPKLAEASRLRAAYLRSKYDVPPSPTDSVKPQTARAQATAAVVVGNPTGGGAQRDERGSSRWDQLTQERTDPKNVRAYRGRLSVCYSQTINDRKPYLLALIPPVAGLSLLYVVAGPGIDLAGLVGKVVELSGPLTYRNELRSYLMEVHQATAE